MAGNALAAGSDAAALAALSVPEPLSTDVCIVGAGFAGSCAAGALARRGVDVVLVDRHASYPPCFKAEKLEPDQTELLRRLDLLDPILPGAAAIHEVRGAENGRVLRARPVEQLGMLYHDMTNALRAALPASVRLEIGHVERIATSDDRQQVQLAGGRTIDARLVVVACGTRDELLRPLGMKRSAVRDEQSLAFGFTIARRDGRPFDFDALTYYPVRRTERVGYLTMFLVGREMRANLWVYWPAADARTRAFLKDPHGETLRLLPGLDRVLGPFAVEGRVETCRIDFFRMEGVVQPGVVLVADAYQSACPTTGLGLSRALTDVEALCACAPDWLATPGMPAAKIERFYADPRKRALDDFALAETSFNREMATNESLPWRLRRAKRRWQKRLASVADYLRLTRKLTA